MASTTMSTLVTADNFSSLQSVILDGVSFDGGKAKLEAEKEKLEAELKAISDKIAAVGSNPEEAKANAIKRAQALAATGLLSAAQVNRVLRDNFGSVQRATVAGDTDEAAKAQKAQDRARNAIPETMRAIVASALDANIARALKDAVSRAKRKLSESGVSAEAMPSDTELENFLKLPDVGVKIGDKRGAAWKRA